MVCFVLTIGDCQRCSASHTFIVQFFNKIGLFPNKRNYEAFMFRYFNATAFMFYYFNATACGAVTMLDLGARS